MIKKEITAGELFGGVWNAKRFKHLHNAIVPAPLSNQVGRLALSGWKFCGLKEKGGIIDFVELERGDEIAMVSMFGNVVTRATDAEN